MGARQSSIKQRNRVLSRLDHLSYFRLSERDFVEDRVYSKNKLRRSGSVRTRRRIFDAEMGTYKPF